MQKFLRLISHIFCILHRFGDESLPVDDVVVETIQVQEAANDVNTADFYEDTAVAFQAEENRAFQSNTGMFQK